MNDKVKKELELKEYICNRIAIFLAMNNTVVNKWGIINGFRSLDLGAIMTKITKNTKYKDDVFLSILNETLFDIGEIQI